MRYQPKQLLRFSQILVLALIISLGSFQFSAFLPGDAQAKPIAAASPAVTIASSSVMIGEDFDFLVTFENTGADPGYGPFVDLVFPLTGQDGDDGINFLSAFLLGTQLEDDVQIIPDAGLGTGCVSHPWLRDASGNYVDVCGNAGDQFVSLRLPFGSYVPGQPRLDITVNAHLDVKADLTPDLLIYGRGGFMFGETPEDDWCCGDAPYAVPNGTDSTTWASSPVTPQVMTFSKVYNGPSNTEDETATGPNYLRTYTLTVDLADNQTLTNLKISDVLPDNIQFTRIVSSSIVPTSTSEPSTSSPGGMLELNFNSMSSLAQNPLTVEFEFYVPDLYDSDGDLADDDPVINHTTGDDVDSDNIAWVDAFWTPNDVRDLLTPLTSDVTCPTCTPLHTLEDKSIAIQKRVDVLIGAVGPDNDPSPGSVMEYTIDFQ
ncbi:MAG: hypothetical protein MUO76_06685, partial [Anaerolineaceae bacterium]|nr:hypothetical protein [Anaerolineaceae bacterium]